MLHFLHKLSFDLTTNRKKLALLLFLDDDYPKKKERKLWVRPINRMRQGHGELHHLNNDESRFFSYFPVSRDSFFRLHELIEDKIKRRITNLRRPIAKTERLHCMFLLFYTVTETVYSVVFLLTTIRV